MSRTDVHRPLPVLRRDPTIRRWFRDRHDHTGGVCDLDVYLAGGDGWIRTSCYRTLGPSAPRLCGCWMCGGRAQRRRDRSRARVAWRQTRAWMLATRDWDADRPRRRPSLEW